jgi:hypothetical protein
MPPALLHLSVVSHNRDDIIFETCLGTIYFSLIMLTRGFKHLCHIFILQDSEHSSESLRGLKGLYKEGASHWCVYSIVVSALLNSQYTEFHLDTDYDLRTHFNLSTNYRCL